MMAILYILVTSGIIFFGMRFIFNSLRRLTKSEKTHLILLTLINLIVVLRLIYVVWKGNDKAIILIVFVYPILVILNGLIWVMLKLFKRREHEIYKISTIGLATFFIPTLLLSTI